MSEPAPQSKINLHALRQHAEPRTRITLRCSEVLALIDAVEAAHAAVRVTEDEDGKRWVSPETGNFGKLLRALEPFDIEPPT